MVTVTDLSGIFLALVLTGTNLFIDCAVNLGGGTQVDTQLNWTGLWTPFPLALW